MNRARVVSRLLVSCVAIGSPLGAQQRFTDAVATADLASGSLTSLAACGARLGGPGAPTEVAPLPGIPPAAGSAAPAATREWSFAGAIGGATTPPAAGSARRSFGGATFRAHFARMRWCAFDAALTGTGATSGAAAATVDARVVLWQRVWAPALEVGATMRAEGMRAGDAGAFPDATARLSATTPNLWANTIGLIGKPALRNWWPQLDLRARVYAGIGAEVQDADGSGARETVDQVGGVIVANLLQKAVSVMASTEQLLSESAGGRPQSQDGVAVAYRLRCCRELGWFVARATRVRAAAARTTTYHIEFAHLGLGAR